MVKRYKGPALCTIQTGNKGRVLTFVRRFGRCWSNMHMMNAPQPLQKQYQRIIDWFCERGFESCDNDHLKPLPNYGLYCLKAFDHRLYAYRCNDLDDKQQLVLLCGWVKDKDAGKSGSNEERRMLERAVTMAAEARLWTDNTTSAGFLDQLELPNTYGKQGELIVPAREVDPPNAKEAVLEAQTERDDADAASDVTQKEGENMGNVERKTEGDFGVQDLSALSDTPISTLSTWCTAELVPGYAINAKGFKRWPWSNVDAVVKCVQDLKASHPSRKHMAKPATAAQMELSVEKIEKFVCTICSKMFDSWASLRGHMAAHADKPKTPGRGLIHLDRLCRQAKISSGTIHHMIDLGFIPKGERKNGMWHVWSTEEAKRIVKLVDAQREVRAQAVRTGWPMSAGKFYCPLCRAEFKYPAEVYSHLYVCEQSWKLAKANVFVSKKPDTTTIDAPKVDAPPPATFIPGGAIKTRKELIAMAPDVVDGKVTAEQYASAIAAYQRRLDTLAEIAKRNAEELANLTD